MGIGQRQGASVMQTETGVRAAELSEEDLDRELTHLHETRRETFLNGSDDALKAHTERMLELEAEYRQRFPHRTEPDQLRTREGSREADGRGA
jgi:hypothetical protein